MWPKLVKNSKEVCLLEVTRVTTRFGTFLSLQPFSILGQYQNREIGLSGGIGFVVPFWGGPFQAYT
jgi:hypothetical protein